MIYLRRTANTSPIDYQTTVAKSGLMLDRTRSIAMYTCKSAGLQGPQGPQGEPYLHDTVIASASPEYTPLQVDLVTPATHFRAPFPINLVYVRVSLSVAPTGADVIIDIHMNGASIFTPGNLLHIDIGSKTSVGSATPPVYAITEIPDDAEFTVFITQVGSIVTGSGVKVAVTGTKVVV